MSTTDRKKRGFGLAAIVLAVPLVASYEGTVLTRYKDPVAIDTICMGETNKDVVAFGALTQQQCTAVLGASLQEHASQVEPCINKPLARHEAAAILSWSYNIGSGAACNSTLIKKLNAGAAPVEWCSELYRWVYAKGIKLNGLVNRRSSEYKMCTTGVWQ